MKIYKIDLVENIKDEIVINDEFVFKLKLRKEKLIHNKERLCLTAKRVGNVILKEDGNDVE